MFVGSSSMGESGGAKSSSDAGLAGVAVTTSFNMDSLQTGCGLMGITSSPFGDVCIFSNGGYPVTLVATGGSACGGVLTLAGVVVELEEVGAASCFDAHGAYWV